MIPSELSETLIAFFERLGLNTEIATIAKGILLLLAITILSVLGNFLAKQLIVKVINVVITKSKNPYDDIFLKRKVFNSLSHIVPALVIYYTIHHAFPQYPNIVNIIQNGTYLYMIVVVVMVINAFLNALHDIYERFSISQEIPIKGYVQLVKIIIYFIAIILVFSVILNKSPLYLFTGLGAVAAVLLLIFRDTILGFVASIQLTAYDMLKPGDWVSMSSHNADGTVLDVSISSVKVENWDKTITTIPTYSMVSNAFVNWKGMMHSGGRRIKRFLQFDVRTIGFLTREQMQNLHEQAFLKPFLQEANTEDMKQNSDPYALKTNFTLFREYVDWYAKNHPELHTTMLNVVRQLQPNEHGIPLEVMVFSKKQGFNDYERIQADIFDHLMAAAPHFHLKIFQQPSGNDLENLRM